MALLRSGDLAMAFTFASYRYGWVNYQVEFLWRGDTLVNHSNLKTGTDYWDDRPPGALLASDDEKDGFIGTLQKVLREDRPAYWEPIDPDITLAIYPDGFFPFLPSHWERVERGTSDDPQAQSRIQKGPIQGPPAEEYFTVIAQVDAYNFKDAKAYHGQGLALHLIVTRGELEAFAQDLEQEYVRFRERWDVPV